MEAKGTRSTISNTEARQGDRGPCKSAKLSLKNKNLEDGHQLGLIMRPGAPMQVRLRDNLDGSSLAHAIQVSMGPLLIIQHSKQHIRKGPCDLKGYTHASHKGRQKKLRPGLMCMCARSKDKKDEDMKRGTRQDRSVRGCNEEEPVSQGQPTKYPHHCQTWAT